MTALPPFRLVALKPFPGIRYRAFAADGVPVGLGAPAESGAAWKPAMKASIVARRMTFSLPRQSEPAPAWRPAP